MIASNFPEFELRFGIRLEGFPKKANQSCAPLSGIFALLRGAGILPLILGYVLGNRALFPGKMPVPRYFTTASYGAAVGNRTTNVAPCPGSLWTSIVPP